MKIHEVSESVVRIPRLIINQILHHAQVSPDACGYITTHDHQFYCHRYCQGVAEFRRGTVAALLTTIRDETARTSSERLLALYQAQSPAVSEEVLVAHWQGLPADLTFLLISMSLKGVLEVKGYQFCNNLTKKVVLELDVL